MNQSKLNQSTCAKLPNRTCRILGFSIKSLLLCSIGCLLVSGVAFAQVDKNSELYKTIIKNDSLLFNVGFNNCDISQFEGLLSEDLEFYHDKAGILNSKSEFIANMKNGLCGQNNPEKVYRFLVEESLEIFPLYDNGKLYGAFQKGKHYFSPNKSMTYNESNNYALFSHLWILEGGTWKIKRVISYNHASKAVEKDLKPFSVSKSALESYSGNYKAPKTGDVTILVNGNNLNLKAGQMTAIINATSETIFTHPQAPLTFEFVKNTEGRISKMIVREHGKIVEEAIKQ